MVELRVRFQVDDHALSQLHALAFGSSDITHIPWAERLERHSVTWVGAFDGEAIVGFVHACWDGGAHAFLLDTVVRPGYQHRGIGRALVVAAADGARAANCEWLHVDFEPPLRAFYLESCGFTQTDAGLFRLR